MLTGFLIYDKYKYKLKAVDRSNTCSLIISSASYDALEFESGVENRNILDERRFDIQMSNVLVQTELDMSTGKKVKLNINNDLFCRVGALVRYVKSHCSKKNEVGYTGMQLASGEFDANPTSDYKIYIPESDTLLATVKLSFGDIQELELRTNNIHISLKEDKFEDSILFPAIKDGIKLGFKLQSSEYLGFNIPVVDVSDFVGNNGMFTNIEDIIAAHPDKEFSWLLGKDYKIVNDDTLEAVCEYIRNWDGYVYYDTETTGLNINFKSRIGQADQLVGVVLSVKYGESFFFPTQMKSIPNLCGGDHFYFMEHYMRPILEGKELVAHNITFDWKVAYIYDINANIVHDTMTIIRLTLGTEKKNYPMGLKENARLILNRDSLELSDLLIDDDWGENDVRFWDLPYELVRLYACADTDNTNGLLNYALQTDLLGRYGAKKVYEIEIAFSFAVAYQEFYGHRIDITNLNTIRTEIADGQALAMKNMVDIVGHDFNPNSPKQLTSILYGELGIPEQISRKTGRPTTDKETLKKLAELTDIEGNIKYPFCAELQKFREYEGVRKIVDKFPEYVTEDGYVFSHVMQFGTTTGRVSTNTPNYQSYNDPIKKNVIPRPGFWMFDTDYSSVEYRVLGNMVGNKRIMESFKDPDFDYHAYQAARMYNVPYSAVTKKMRKAAKGINFGLPYGMGDESLGIRVFGDKSAENTRKAAALRNAYFKGQEDIRDWFEYHRDKGVNLGYTETYFGRRRYYHREDFSVSAIRRQAGNQVIQGCILGDTLIHERVAGTVKIKDLAGYKAEVWNGTDWVTGDILYSGKKRKCIVKFRGGYEMICSPQHKFLVRSHRGNDRFVECKDLIPLYDGDRVRKNAHRVVVGQDFCPSLHKYKSERIYDSEACNANNVYLDYIEDSFTRGVVLGRLSSDGSLDVNRGRIKQFVAEHELDVYDYLVKAMSPLGCHYKINEVRKDRNESIAHISVYSKSLAKEIESLDIRHTIDPRIWADTEMLRGFLCGLFDGNGGVAGKTITFVQGTQENFEPFMKEIQKALLFFGIRSRYRSYDDRYVLQIKTTDNDRFVEAIGFVNEQKQLLASQLECIEDEHVFGRCLMVESVEITDELVDMYDVCNTPCGCYVADGVVTHNTAADIYKTAVGRVFKRICKEGLLGKVLFSGFIHDELLGEVSNDINPAIWLKILREEFEVKITNPDGSSWCPLYMGFGYGTSWYEAKSVELPIKLQWEIVDKYGETGFPNWDCNPRKFCDSVPDMLRDFEVRDIRNQLLDPSSQNKEIKPTLNNQILAMCKEDSEIYVNALSDYMQGDSSEVNRLGEQTYIANNESQICKYLDETYHIQSLMKDVDGSFILDFKPAKTTQEAITQYCALHGVDRTKINILDIPDVTITEDKPSGIDSDVSYYDEYEDELDEDKLAKIIDTKIQTFGMYPDIENKRIYLLLPHPDRNRVGLLTQLKKFTNTNGDGYNIVFRDYWEKPGDRPTTNFISSANLSSVQNLYIAYLGGRIL